ncbi:efflux RND transporter periplasmic adaptor subunit [Methyloradius palustris]|uniref:MexE family multidrug efflux RND transporter periplasmic adaptor subunit n=1 Tax=Methyloradius palustris TaxID=2778876 RepID=A0A8D5G8S4_9PROT|nr:efflux RND transporter periplasmic adaptor subunit [Methyloradius palustris]BCM25237.1 MexE family multidrug efflux RND transporter periplasmic adaptor subunit [Methyloradius palustris]
MAMFRNHNQKQSGNREVSVIKKPVSILMLGLVAFTLFACGKKDQAGGQMPPMPVSVIEIQPASVPVSAEAVAQTEGAKEVEIRPRVGGILLKRLYEEGESVKAGQAMFQIDPVPYQIALAQARAVLAQQKAKVEQTEREEARLKNLLATQSISQREYDNSLSDNDVAKASLLQSEASVREAELNLSYTTVTAPVSGISGRFQFSEGALVSANTSLLTTLVQLSPIWVRFSFSDSELAKLGGHLSDKTVKEVELIMPDGSQYMQKGKLNFAASQIDPALGTQQLRATFENSDKRLLPGQFVRARITTGSHDGVFLVPQAAVSSAAQGKFVYVLNEKNEATVRTIVPGDWVGTDWIILDGLKAGDKVIVDNIIKLRPGAPVSPHPFGEAPAGAPSAQPAKQS